MENERNSNKALISPEDKDKIEKLLHKNIENLTLGKIYDLLSEKLSDLIINKTNNENSAIVIDEYLNIQDRIYKLLYPNDTNDYLDPNSYQMVFCKEIIESIRKIDEEQETRLKKLNEKINKLNIPKENLDIMKIKQNPFQGNINFAKNIITQNKNIIKINLNNEIRREIINKKSEIIKQEIIPQLNEKKIKNKDVSKQNTKLQDEIFDDEDIDNEPNDNNDSEKLDFEYQTEINIEKIDTNQDIYKEMDKIISELIGNRSDNENSSEWINNNNNIQLINITFNYCINRILENNNYNLKIKDARDIASAMYIKLTKLIENKIIDLKQVFKCIEYYTLIKIDFKWADNILNNSSNITKLENIFDIELNKFYDEHKDIERILNSIFENG